MGYFKNLEIEVIDMYHSDGMKESEIATSLGIPLTQVHSILAAYDKDCDADADEGESDADVVSYEDLEFDPGDIDYNAEHY
jgi:DNA-directed RNA polymerase specialized sigma24 family protein